MAEQNLTADMSDEGKNLGLREKWVLGFSMPTPLSMPDYQGGFQRLHQDQSITWKFSFLSQVCQSLPFRVCIYGTLLS